MFSEQLAFTIRCVIIDLSGKSTPYNALCSQRATKERGSFHDTLFRTLAFCAAQSGAAHSHQTDPSLAVLLIAVFMTGCTKQSEAPNTTSPEADTQSESDGLGVYVMLEIDNANSLYLHGGSFSKVCKNADGAPLKAGEWIFTGEDLVEISRQKHCSVLVTVGALDADDMLLGESTFLYDKSQEKLYVTISVDDVTCSTSDAADAPADVPSVLTLPILDEINDTVTVATFGSSLLAVWTAAKQLD